MSQVKCQECGLMVDKLQAVQDDKKKNYHPKCLTIKKEKEELYALVCDVFKFKAPGPRVYAQVKKYLADGYTVRGIINAVDYFFNVKHNPIEKANNGLGIVPYVYEEANEYFNRLEYKKKKIAESVTQFSADKKVVVLRPTQKTKKQIFDMNDL